MIEQIIKLLNSDNTVSANRLLAHALGIKAALLFNSLVGKQAYYEKHSMLDSEGWFYSTIEDMQESTALSRCQQNKAIGVLVKAGLIDYRTGGVHCRRHFRVRDDTEQLEKYLIKGAEKLNSNLSEIDNAPCENTAYYPVENAQSTLREIDNPFIYNLNNQTKENNPYPSIISDGTHMTGNSQILFSSDERSDYRDIIRENIEYDCLSEDKVRVDELVEIMLDVVCSAKSTTRVNGDEVPTDVVKSRLLKLTHEHIEYVLTALGNNTSDVRNIRAYLITALYNAPITMDSYYTVLVNHDMYGKPDRSE